VPPHDQDREQHHDGARGQQHQRDGERRMQVVIYDGRDDDERGDRADDDDPDVAERNRYRQDHQHR
jgi:hypothetical protein